MKSKLSAALAVAGYALALSVGATKFFRIGKGDQIIRRSLLSGALALALLPTGFLTAIPASAQVAGLNSCGTDVNTPPSRIDLATQGSRIRDAISCLINAERTSQRLPALSVSPRLQNAAAGHAQAAGTLRWWTQGANPPDPHVNPQTGSTPDSRIKSANYCAGSPTQDGEIVYSGGGNDPNTTKCPLGACSTPAAAVNWWMNISHAGHREAILSSGFRQLGVGVSGVDANGDDPLQAEMGAYVVDLGDCPTLDLGAIWLQEGPLGPGDVAVAPGTSPTSWYTTPENVQHIAYVGNGTDPRNRIYALFKFVPSGAPWGSEGPLGPGDVAVAPGTSPTSWYTTPENVQHIAYVGVGADQRNRIYAVFKPVPSGAAWGVEGPLGDVDVAPGTSPTSWYTTPENVQHIAYVGTDKRIHALFKPVPSGASWGIEGPLGDVDAAPLTSPTSWYTTPENFQHIAYVGNGTDPRNRIYALFKFVPSGAPWGSEGPLGPGDVAVASGASPTSWYTTPENVQHIAYVGNNQHIYSLFFAIGR